MLKKLIILLFFGQVFSFLANASDEKKVYSGLQRRDISKAEVEQIKSDLETIQKLVKNFGTLEVNCNNDFEKNIKKKVWKLHSNENNKDLILTDLTMVEAIAAFNRIKNNKKIPFNMSSATNVQAHMIDIELEKQGIVAGKIFIEGKLYYKIDGLEVLWPYVSASLIIVDRVPYVIDPVHFKAPVSFDKWEKKMIENPKTKLNSMYFTDRYSYDTSDKDQNYKEYQEDSINNMNSVDKFSCKATARENGLDAAEACRIQ
jgi:hypothetical protein